jgi:UDP-N-acetylmuramoyl-L-alanyl-D-glutamate--2,6-diaminopimelate ligase
MNWLKNWAHLLFAYGANLYYGQPSRKLIVIGVTGTKGKSTTCRLIAGVLEAAGFEVGLLSTVEFQVGSRREANKFQMTMLGRGRIQKYLREMVNSGCQYAVIETSSEGILQHRQVGIHYDVAVFTNLGTEHQERHGGFENLKLAKGKLFRAIQGARKVLHGQEVLKQIVVNGESEHAPFFASFWADAKWVVGKTTGRAPQVFKNLAATNTSSSQHEPQNTVLQEVLASAVEVGTTSSLITANGQQYTVGLPGAFNADNALLAIAVGRGQNISDSIINEGLKNVTQVAGRMEFIDEGQDFSFVVDYAHEPMSFTALFTTLRQHVKNGGKLVGIIGSDGGGRDTGKRHSMGRIAGELCDVVIVTDVNPWDEDPQQIAEMLANGARAAGKKDNQNLYIVINRRKAIEKACAEVGSGGVVAITAKGTESSIIGKGGERQAWSDSGQAHEALRLLKTHS